MIAGDSTRTELCSVHSQRINIKPFLSTATTAMLRVCPVDCGGGAGCCTMAGGSTWESYDPIAKGHTTWYYLLW